MDEARQNKAVELYESGWTVGAIARHFGCATGVISRDLNRAGVRSIVRAIQIDPTQDREIARLYLDERWSSKRIAEKFGVAVSSVPMIVRRAGGNTRDRGPQHIVLSAADTKRLVEQWGEGKSIRQLSKIWKFNPDTMTRLLKDAGVQFRHKKATGEHHGMWRGGRIMAHGYWHLIVRDDSPFISMRTKRGYAAEHRLVLAQKLGRPLTVDETCHHINGNKLDNRPENLQLRLGPHGKNECYACMDCGSRNIKSVPIDEAT